MSYTPITISRNTSDEYAIHSRAPRWHRVLAAVLGVLAFGGYMSLNVWLFTLGKIQRSDANHTDIPFSARTGTSGDATVLGEFQERPAQPSPTPVSRSSNPSSFHTVRNLSATSSPSGPGPYACDPLGKCNLYKNPVSAGCPVTFADPLCLSQCGNPKNQCKE